MNGSRKIIQTYTTELLLLLSIELIFPQITVMNLPESLTIAEETIGLGPSCRSPLSPRYLARLKNR